MISEIDNLMINIKSSCSDIIIESDSDMEEVNNEIQEYKNIKELNNSIDNIINDAFDNKFQQKISLIGEITNIKFFKNNVGLSLYLKDESDCIICKLWRYKFPNIKEIGEYENMTCKIEGTLKKEYFGNKYTFLIEILTIEKHNSESYIKNLIDECNKKNYFVKKNIDWNNIKHIGLISKKNTQGYNDFIKQLIIPVKITLKTIILEGKDTEKSLIDAINKFQTSKVDIIIIIRGGGSTFDISQSYDKMPIYDCMKISKIPILTAIGHEADKDDKLLINNVSDYNFATPTDAALTLNKKFMSILLNKVNDNINFLQNLKKNMLDDYYGELIINIYRYDNECEYHTKNEHIITLPINYDKDYIVIHHNNNYYKISLIDKQEIDINMKYISLTDKLKGNVLNRNLTEIKNAYNMLSEEYKWNCHAIQEIISELVKINENKNIDLNYLKDGIEYAQNIKLHKIHDERYLYLITCLNTYKYCKDILEKQDDKETIQFIYENLN